MKYKNINCLRDFIDLLYCGLWWKYLIWFDSFCWNEIDNKCDLWEIIYM